MGFKLATSGRCAVIGHGSWATAMVKVFSLNKLEVEWYIRNQEVLESLQTEGRNCRYLADVEFDRSFVHFSDDLNEVVGKAEIIWLASPAAYLTTYLKPLTVSLRDKFVVSTIKGLMPGKFQTITDYMHKKYRIPYEQLAFISGPAHAEEVSHSRTTHLTVASPDLDNAQRIGDLLHNDFIMLNHTSEMNALELSAVMKNIYSVVAGIAVGLGYGDNFIAVLVSNAAKEIYLFLKKHGFDYFCQAPSAILGDLLVTCYSSHSRNRQLGVLIGRGNTVKTSLNEMTMIAEGYYAANFIRNVSQPDLAEMPIAQMAYQVLYEKVSARKAMKRVETLMI
ncbi:MAG: NAD(P)H-dependent glycerol-3-phosphate dehydrogenase [Candidatus Limimorpha sp.]